MLAARLRLLLAALWAGSLWTVGYLAAPTLFVTLPDRMLAGTIAGSLFAVQAWLSLACAVLLGALVAGSGALSLGAGRQHRQLRRHLLSLIAAMLACTLLVHFGLQPWIAGLRMQAMAAQLPLGLEFRIVHGGASLVYLLQSVLAGWLLLKLK